MSSTVANTAFGGIGGGSASLNKDPPQKVPPSGKLEPPEKEPKDGGMNWTWFWLIITVFVLFFLFLALVPSRR